MMLGWTKLLQIVVKTRTECLPLNFVRFRKPRWAPIAPTKLFYVPEHKKRNVEESEELKKRYAHYRTYMRAFRKHLEEELFAKEAALTGKLHMEKERQHLDWLSKTNNEWNKQSASLREARLVQDITEKNERDLKILMDLENEDRRRRDEALASFLKAKEEAKHFVTPEMLDSEIDAALNKRPTYCFAIDTDGRRYVEQPDGSTVIEDKVNNPTTTGEEHSKQQLDEEDHSPAS